MRQENEHKEPETDKKIAPEEKKIHHTHFPVLKIPLHNVDFNSLNEWVKSGLGRWKLVPKKKGK